MDFSERRVRLGDLDLEPARFVPDLTAYPPPSGDPLEGTEGLLDGKPYSDWWHESPDAYAFVGGLAPERRPRPGDPDIDAFARAFYAPQRGRIADRLACTLDLCANHRGKPAAVFVPRRKGVRQAEGSERTRAGRPPELYSTRGPRACLAPGSLSPPGARHAWGRRIGCPRGR